MYEWDREKRIYKIDFDLKDINFDFDDALKVLEAHSKKGYFVTINDIRMALGIFPQPCELEMCYGYEKFNPLDCEIKLYTSCLMYIQNHHMPNKLRCSLTLTNVEYLCKFFEDIDPFDEYTLS